MSDRRRFDLFKGTTSQKARRRNQRRGGERGERDINIMMSSAPEKVIIGLQTGQKNAHTKASISCGGGKKKFQKWIRKGGKYQKGRSK